MKRKMASLPSLNTFSMASLLKGMTSVSAEASRRVTRRTSFIDLWKFKNNDMLILYQSNLTRRKYFFLQSSVIYYDYFIIQNLFYLQRETIWVVMDRKYQMRTIRQERQRQQFVMSKEKGNQELINSTGRKSKYFEKYRNQLDKINNKMKKPPASVNTFTNHSHPPKQSRLKPTSLFKEQIKKYTPPIPESLLKVPAINVGEFISRSNTSKSNEGSQFITFENEEMQYQPASGEESPVIIHTFTDFSSQIQNLNSKNKNNSRPSIQASLIQDQSPQMIKRSKTNENQMWFGDIAVQKVSSHHFTFTNIEEKQQIKPKQGFQDVIDTFFSPTRTKKSQNLKVREEEQKPKEDIRKSMRTTFQRKASYCESIPDLDKMTKEFQMIKERTQNVDKQIGEKRAIINALEGQRQGKSQSEYMKNIVNHAQKILFIQQKIKDTKKQHEQELKKLASEKKYIHEQNVEISKQIETCDQQIELHKRQYEALDKKYSEKFLETKSTKLQKQIKGLDRQKQLAENRKNNASELQEISYGEFKRFSDAWMKKMIGREIKLAEERIKYNDFSRYQTQVQKKKIQLKDKKIQIQLKKKRIYESNRIIENLEKSIKQLKKEQMELKSKRKITIFDHL